MTIKMKKIMILAAGFALAAPAFAQVTISPELGINLANIHQRTYTANSGGTFSPSTVNENGGLKIGVRAGANVDFWIADRISIQPGLFYSIKGAKFGSEPAVSNKMVATGDNNITLHYAEIPLNVQYYFNDPGEGRFFVGLGGYAGIAFSGRNRYSGEFKTIPGMPNEAPTQLGVRDYKFGNDAPSNDIRRFDFGAGANLGYLTRMGLYARAQYQLGLSNMVPQGNRPAAYKDDKATNSVFTIAVGYQIGNHNQPRSKAPAATM
jgi:hypothetical protein